MMISGTTKLCAVIGDPVEHSISPRMHNAAFEKLGLDYTYAAFRVTPDNLAAAVAGVRALNITGLSVTIPHKVAVIPLLDEIDPIAQKIGAVNTIINQAGKLTGFNTDAEGFIRALRENRIDVSGKKIAVIGAGGASRAVSYILAANGAELTVFNRREHLARAESVAAMVEAASGHPVKVMPLEDAAQGLKNIDVLVNATSVGMFPQTAFSPVPSPLLKGIPVVVDIIYNPRQTKLLLDAKQAGAKTLDGLEMLAWQGALAFEKWTGRLAPFDVMRREAAKALTRI